ncbi:MAG: DUF4350 domain-containing protein [Chitinophagaceae bacterium]|nr:DUF4350 domain-containing protein [Chitinophagaceae bacterium]
MKKALPYIAGMILLLLLLALIWGGKKDQFDHRVTLNRKDKIPYGTYVAYNNLKYIFPEASLNVNKKEPGYWEDEIVKYDTGNQTMFIVTKEFNATRQELTELFHFVSRGNDVLIAAYDFSLDARLFFHMNLSYADAGYQIDDFIPSLDTLELSLSSSPFTKEPSQFKYPGRKFYSFFDSFDTSMSYVMSRTIDSAVVCLRMRAGNGSFFIHTAPLAFSNYFLLHKQNISYYNNLLSALDPATTNVIWDEYFIHKPAYDQPKDPSPLRVLLAQRSFRTGLLTALVGLILFMALGLKRRQRMIPVIKSPANDSLDFVKTIGRLYFQKKDNRNLAQKMTAYFTEYVHNHYHIPTDNMDNDFVVRLSQKSGCDEKTIQLITDCIKFVQENSALHDQQLSEFYTSLNKFYKTS